MSAPQIRPVRVTLEGEASEVEGRVVFVGPDGDNTVLYTDRPGVTVEWLRDWRDGDVVLSPADRAFQRLAGTWRCSVGGGVGDFEVTRWADEDPDRVLRYQALADSLEPVAEQTCEGGC